MPRCDGALWCTWIVSDVASYVVYCVMPTLRRKSIVHGHEWMPMLLYLAVMMDSHATQVGIRDARVDAPVGVGVDERVRVAREN